MPNDSSIPFIGFRAASDGMGDPLILPAFPAQFFAYRPLTADNAAAVTIALLEAWAWFCRYRSKGWGSSGGYFAGSVN